MRPFETRLIHRDGAAVPDQVAVEEPLEMRVDGQALAITMRTPGHDADLLLGFLLTEGVIEDRDDLSAIATVADNVIDCRLAAGVDAHREALEAATRTVLGTSACGLCGKARLDQVRVFARAPLDTLVFDDLPSLPDLLRPHQEGFAATGGLHAAALIGADRQVLCVREDIGRHNAVDKVLGWRLQHAPGCPAVLVVSSRAGFEIVQKARMAGIGTVVAVGAASTLAVDLAIDQGMTLLGFARRGKANRYA